MKRNFISQLLWSDLVSYFCQWWNWTEGHYIAERHFCSRLGIMNPSACLGSPLPSAKPEMWRLSRYQERSVSQRHWWVNGSILDRVPLLNRVERRRNASGMFPAASNRKPTRSTFLKSRVIFLHNKKSVDRQSSCFSSSTILSNSLCVSYFPPQIFSMVAFQICLSHVSKWQLQLQILCLCLRQKKSIECR